MHDTHNMNRALMWDFEANENETIPSYVTHVDSYVINRRLITFPQLGSWISYGETGNRTPVSAVTVRNAIHWATRPRSSFKLGNLINRNMSMLDTEMGLYKC